MSYQRLCAMRLNRKILGSELNGITYDPEGYRYSSEVIDGELTGFVFVIAQFACTNGTCPLQGEYAVFLMNSDIDDLELIAVGERTSVPMSSNWVYYGRGVINSFGEASVKVNRLEISLFAIAAYCPITTRGDVTEIRLGNNI